MLTVAQNRSSWPRDQADWVFLGNAVDQLGRAHFDAEWTGTEETAPILSPLPAWTAAHNKSTARWRHEAHGLLAEVEGYIACPSVQRLPRSFAAMHGRVNEIVDYEFSERQWELAQRLRAGEIERILPAHARLGRVRTELATLFTEGSIATGLREKRLAEVQPIAPNIWSVVRLHAVFSQFQMLAREPGTHYDWGDGFAWVFVLRQDLNRHVEGIDRSHEQPEETCVVGAAAPSTLQSARKGGRRPTHDPSVVREIVFDLMNDNGEFSPDDDWNSQACLERAVREKLNSSLGESSLREAVVPHLALWRAGKAGNSK